MDEILRELLEHKIEALDERVDLRFCSRDKELVKQAAEYERLLTDLNHGQARLAADRERYMPREIADQRQKDLDDWKLSIEKTRSESMGARRWETVIVSAIISAVIFIASKSLN